MQQDQTSQDSTSNDDADVGWSSESTLYITWRGRGTSASVRSALLRVRGELPGRKLRFLICDTLAVTGYEASLREPAHDLLNEVRAAGMQELIVVAQNSALRMLGAALGLVIGVKARIVTSRDEAMKISSAP